VKSGVRPEIVALAGLPRGGGQQARACCTRLGCVRQKLWQLQMWTGGWKERDVHGSQRGGQQLHQNCCERYFGVFWS